jgi:hypothetical protein
MKTPVLMAGVAEMADILLLSNDPGMVDFRKTQPAGQLEKYSQVTGDIDAIHFVGKAAPIPLLLQFANYEQASTRLQCTTRLLPRAIRRRCYTTTRDTI